MKSVLILLFLASGQSTPELIRDISQSGRVLEIGTPESERLSSGMQIAPGVAPLISFRLLEGRQHNRYANLDLVIDDAGH